MNPAAVTFRLSADGFRECMDACSHAGLKPTSVCELHAIRALHFEFAVLLPESGLWRKRSFSLNCVTFV